jgi:prevent-host-death family protein
MDMKEISVFDAKMHFSGLIDKVYSNHEEITITRRGKQVAKIIPIETKKKQEIEIALKELQSLSEEIGPAGITLNDIKKMKEEGRK